jgi:hypothetical protein
VARTGRDEPLLTRAGAVTSGFLRLVGMRPAGGRLLDDRDEQAGAPATAMLGHWFWLEKLSGDPAITGATLVLDGKPYQVVGVGRRRDRDRHPRRPGAREASGAAEPGPEVAPAGAVNGTAATRAAAEGDAHGLVPE